MNARGEVPGEPEVPLTQGVRKSVDPRSRSSHLWGHSGGGRGLDPMTSGRPSWLQLLYFRAVFHELSVSHCFQS